jgi:hypothetical protein
MTPDEQDAWEQSLDVLRKANSVLPF